MVELNLTRLPLRAPLILIVALTASSCGYFAARDLDGKEAVTPDNFTFVGDKSPCYLELQQNTRALRVNCFHLGGVLHIHSSRWARLPRLSGESWTVTIRRKPKVRVQIDDRIYVMNATAIDDEDKRVAILSDRGYWYAWEGITVFQFIPSSDTAAGNG